MTILAARAVSKAFGPSTLFRDVEFSVNEGDRIGLLGINGTGKSTLMRVLVGEEPADTGLVERKKGLRMQYLSQEPPLPKGATAYEAVLEGLGEWAVVKRAYDDVLHRLAEGDASLVDEQARLSAEIERLGGWELGYLAEELLTKLGFADHAQSVDSMSGGERRRVALARILISKPELAVLDEPTNHLDADTIEWLEEYLLEKFEGAIVFVTHDRYVLDTLATRIFELDRGTLRAFDGGYEDYLDKKEELLAQEERTEANRQNLIRRERAWLMRGAKARTTKQKARIQRAEAIIKADPLKKPEAIELGDFSHADRTGKTILEFEDLTVGYPSLPLISGLTMNLTRGARIGIVGKNGYGKTTLFKTITGDLAPILGRCELGKNTKIAYFDQARANLQDTWSIYDNVAEREGSTHLGGGIVRIGEREMELRAYLELFLFDAGKQRQAVGALSGGERARVALAKMLKTGANLLLLDEPTNDLDTFTLAALEDMLGSWPGVVLAISHDRYFLNRVATSILAIEEGSTPRKATLYPGNYDDYRNHIQNARESIPQTLKSVPPPAPAASKSSAPEAKPARKLSYKDQRDYDTIMARIEQAESRVVALEAELAKPDVYANAKLTAEKHTELTAAQAEAARLVARWEELEALRASV